MKNVLILIVVLAIAGGGYYWYSQDASVNGAMTGTTNNDKFVPPTPPPPPTKIDSTSTAGVKEFTFTNTGMTFDQKSFSVKKDDRVKVTYMNKGGTHDLRIDGYDVGTKVIQKDQSETFEFVADKAGTFEFFCSVGNHRAMGMKGTFTVTE